MCGRFAATLPPDVYRTLFGYPETPNFPSRYNIAPTQPVAVVVEQRSVRHFRLMRWGLLPGWVKDPKTFPLLFNARGESLDVKPAFRNAFRRRRCVFIADGFYEWRRAGSAKQPYLVRMRDRGPMPLAGIWETYADPDGGEIDTAAIVTTDANGTLSAIHERMPVILSSDGIAPWLAGDGVPLDAASRLVRPCPDGWIDMVRVGMAVNAVANEGPEVQAPADEKPAAAGDAHGRLF